MSIQYLPHLDPVAEMNFTLERCFGQSPDIPNSVPALCESLSQKYSIPMEELTTLLAPVQAMEKELYELLDGQTAPLEPFCSRNPPRTAAWCGPFSTCCGTAGARTWGMWTCSAGWSP